MNNYLPILAIETSSELCSVAILKGENNFVEINFLERHVHSKKIIGLIDSIIKNADYQVSDIKSVAVSMGPGSFTGLRIGLSAAKGIAYGSSIPIIPVPTFDAMAMQINSTFPADNNFAVVSNANSEELFFTEYLFSGGILSTVKPLELISKYSLKETNVGMIFSNNSGGENQVYLPMPYAHYIARWAYLFGKDLLTFKYDNLEPNYFKNFILRGKR